MTYSELSQLFQKYREGIATEEEVKQFIEALRNPETEGVVKELMEKEADVLDSMPIPLDSYDISDERAKEIFGQIITNRHETPVVDISKSKSRLKVWRSIAAASIILIATLTIVIPRSKNKVNNLTVAQVKHDVTAPTATKATITLADGSLVYLDSIGTGTLAQQGNIEVIKNSKGEIEYKTVASNNSELLYNSMFNPRGSNVINLTLQDGTKVWLNNESSIKYPTAFVGKDRRVEITGEAYFEVAKDPAKPFKVKLNDGSEVEVLGTHFNINAYVDDAKMKTTLLEGKVRVTKGTNKIVIVPGEQAVAESNSLSINRSADLEQVMAWKNGLFRFRGTNIKEIMKQAERWYNIEVVYEGNVSDLDFSGFVSRKENVSRLLKMFETTGLVHFIVEGNKVTVKK